MLARPASESQEAFEGDAKGAGSASGASSPLTSSSVAPSASAPEATVRHGAPHGERRFVDALGRGDLVEDVFLLRKLDLRRTKAGKDYIACELADRTGTLAARHWEGTKALHDRLLASPFALARGVVEEWGQELQVKLRELVPVPAGEVDLRDLIEHTPFDVDVMHRELRSIYCERVRDRFIRTLLLSFVEDEEFVAKLKKAPAASSYHHSYAGGLLEHILSLTKLAENVCDHYVRLDRDLMTAGVFLHDIGKVDELAWNLGFQYTDKGQLVGHITIGVLLLEERARRIRGFPDRLRDVLRHLILSHHGEKEFGSPVVPVMPEAIALHMIDNLDGKLWSSWKAMDDGAGDPRWSAPSRHLGNRRIYRGPVREDGSPEPKVSAKEPSVKEASLFS